EQPGDLCLHRGPAGGADDDVADDAVPVDEEAAGDAGDAVIEHRLAASVEDEAPAVLAVAGVGEVLLDLRTGLLDVDAQDDETAVAVRLVDLLDVGHLDLAGAAPGRPEVDEDRLPAQVAQLDDFAVERLEREIG